MATAQSPDQDRIRGRTFVVTGALPTQLLVELHGTVEVFDSEGDEADPLLHANENTDQSPGAEEFSGGGRDM